MKENKKVSKLFNDMADPTQGIMGYAQLILICENDVNKLRDFAEKILTNSEVLQKHMVYYQTHKEKFYGAV